MIVLPPVPAVWPAEDRLFSSPEQAAEDFVATVFTITPQLGEFQPGDSRSGEIEVQALPESGSGEPFLRSVLLLRQLGPDNGWFVIGAINDQVTITTPDPTAEIQPGVVSVSGVGRGFEGTVVVAAYRPGESEPFDVVIAQGGAAATAEPYSVDLDLSGSESGEPIFILARGDVGLDNDPGEFSAVPLIVGE